jgi:acyl-[acyl-carrier-protein] desaturase
MTLSDTTRLLHELEPVVAENLDRHLATTKEWMPHEYIPWSQGRDFVGPDGEPWSVEQSRLSPIARTALELNLLTEDNLPSYHREIERAFGNDGPWGTWVGRWTAEEGRHGYALRDYLLVTRGVDPEQLERARMATMTEGFDSGDKPLLRVCAYVSFQELATRVSHRNTGKYTEDPIANKLMARISMDENLHMIFYRNLVTASLEISPDEMVQAIRDEIVDFQMPGAGIEGFQRKAFQMAQAGIYDQRNHLDDVVMPLLRHWGVMEMEGLGAQGEQARAELAAFLEDAEVQANRFVEKREAAAVRRAERTGAATSA